MYNIKSKLRRNATNKEYKRDNNRIFEFSKHRLWSNLSKPRIFVSTDSERISKNDRKKSKQGKQIRFVPYVTVAYINDRTVEIFRQPLRLGTLKVLLTTQPSQPPNMIFKVTCFFGDEITL